MVHYTEQLRVLTLGDPHRVEKLVPGAPTPRQLDARTVAVARLGALIAHGGSVSSFGPEVEGALAAGVSPAEVVEVLLAVASVVGVPCIVTAAPAVGLALGYDTEAALEARDSGAVGP